MVAELTIAPRETGNSYQGRGMLMIELMPKLRRHFDCLQDRFAVFYNHSVQLEGWFKGELLFLAGQMVADGLILAVEHEIKVGAKRVDLMLELPDGRHWIELKHWHIGKQGGSTYSPGFYFGDPTSVGITREVRALGQLDVLGRRWLLLLLTRNPGVDQWEAGLKRHSEKFDHTIVAHTNPNSYPDSYFLGLLEVIQSNKTKSFAA